MTENNATEASIEEVPLLDEMYRARKRLFIDRVGWDLIPDDEGREKDPLDTSSATYVIDRDDRHRHRGSVRLLPTTGDTVLSERVADLLGGFRIASPSIWEYTRFCVIGQEGERLAQADIERVSVNLMLAICETCIAAEVDHVIGSFGRHMDDLFKQSGWRPEVLGRSGRGRSAVYLGIWETTEMNADALRDAGGRTDSVIVRSLR